MYLYYLYLFIILSIIYSSLYLFIYFKVLVLLHVILYSFAEVDLPSHVAGLWTGQFFSSNGTTEPTYASLAFLAQGSAYPSIFGATLDAQDRVGIVHGSWQRDFNKVNMKEITDDVSKQRRRGEDGERETNLL